MQIDLFIRRLMVVNSQNQYAYDQQFHRGVNIIRGQNSSGKSTIIRFIFYVLGGCYGDFVPEAMACKMVVAEVETGGQVLTLKRPLDKTEDGTKVNRYNPMYIYNGSIEEFRADQRPKEQKWKKYGYKIGNDRYSFSNVLFKLMGLPEFKADSTITMHQILRLVYLDQESPLSSLFFFEQFDKELTRTMVAELLMGLYDEKLSRAMQRQAEVIKRQAEVKQLIKLTKEFLSDPNTQSSAFILSTIERLNEEMKNITQTIQALRQSEVPGSKFQDSSSKSDLKPETNLKPETWNLKLKPEYQRMQEDIEGYRKQRGELNEQITGMKREMLDSELFVFELQRDLYALDRAISTRDVVSKMHLIFCSACLAPLGGPEEEGKCHLCHKPLDNKIEYQNARRDRGDLERQIMESQKLLKLSEEELKEKEAQRRSLTRKLNDAQRQYDIAVGNVRSTHEERIDQLLHDKGYKEREIDHYGKLLEYAEKYEALLKEQSDLRDEASELERYIEAANNRIRSERWKIERVISENGVYLLKHDQDRQAEFRNAKDFRMDFEQNVAYLTDHHIKLSASSAFYLKMAARFAFFLSSVQVESMMYPRLLLSDNMEDKGMEEERSRNFQRIVVQRLQELGNPNYQVIFATSNIAPELDNEKYTIGEFYTEGNKSLKI